MKAPADFFAMGPLLRIGSENDADGSVSLHFPDVPRPIRWRKPDFDLPKTGKSMKNEVLTLDGAFDCWHALRRRRWQSESHKPADKGRNG